MIYEFNLTLFEEAQLASKYSKVNFFECNNIINAHSFAKKSEYLKNSAKYSLCREIINFLKFGGQKDPVLINIKLVTEENIENNYGSNETESSPQIMSPISPDVSSETALIIDISDSHDNEDKTPENIQEIFFRSVGNIDNQSLSVVLLNIQSLRYKKDELYVFLESLSYPSVVLLTEHWLKEYEPLHVLTIY